MSKNIDDKIVYTKDLRPSTAKKIDSIVDIISEIAKAEYERGKEDEKRWWSGFCAKCTDEDKPQGEWIDKGTYAECSNCGADSGTQYDGIEPVPRKTNYCPNCGAYMKGVDNEAIGR